MKRSLVLVLACLALMAGACSGDDGDATTTTLAVAPGESTSTATGDSSGGDATSTTGDEVSTTVGAEDNGTTTTIEPDDASTTTTETPDDDTTTTTETPDDDTTTTTEAPDDDTTTTTLALSGSFPVTVISDAGPTTIDAPPMRMAVLTATHVEMVYALGAGDRVIAVDVNSDFPADAAGKVQLDSFNLSVEEVIATDPDLVVLTFDPVGAVAALESVGIPTLLLGTATTLESAYLQMAVLGSATGLEDESDDLVAELSSTIADIVAGVGGAGAGMSYYHESDPFTFYTPTSASFIGQIYSLFGMENIADAAPDAAGQTFPQLSPEFIVASDPEIIFSTDPSADIAVYTDRNGWGSMTAVTDGSVYFLDADVASRWGPRLVDLVAAIAAAIQDHVG